MDIPVKVEVIFFSVYVLNGVSFGVGHTLKRRYMYTCIITHLFHGLLSNKFSPER